VVTEINVHLRINHTYDRDLVLALEHPDGTEVLLVRRRGRSGDHFGTGECGEAVYTVLDQGAAQSITNGTAPFAGTYRPEGTLGAFTGKPLNGIWRLRMSDVESGDAGTNLCWGIQAVYEQRSYECTIFSNRRPQAHAAELWVTAPGPTNFTLGGSDEDGQALTFEARSAPAHGIFTLHSPATGAATYAPVHGYAGTDAVAFAVSDGLETSAEAVVTFVMPPPEDANFNGLPDAWELRHWTNLVEALPDGDDDGDGVPNWAEERANTNPRDSNSMLRLLPFEAEAGPELRWRSVGGTRYRVEWTDDLAGGEFQEAARPLAEEVDPSVYGAEAIRSFTDDYLEGEGGEGGPVRIYRIRVLNE
jgi:subtilisin-like proprotein convertase family protein